MIDRPRHDRRQRRRRHRTKQCGELIDDGAAQHLVGKQRPPEHDAEHEDVEVESSRYPSRSISAQHDALGKSARMHASRVNAPAFPIAAGGDDGDRDQTARRTARRARHANREPTTPCRAGRENTKCLPTDPSAPPIASREATMLAAIGKSGVVLSRRARLTSRERPCAFRRWEWRARQSSGRSGRSPDERRRNPGPAFSSQPLPDFTEPVIGRATSGRTRSFHPARKEKPTADTRRDDARCRDAV